MYFGAYYNVPAKIVMISKIYTKDPKQTVSWSNAEILALLDIWTDVDIQAAHT